MSQTAPESDLDPLLTRSDDLDEVGDARDIPVDTVPWLAAALRRTAAGTWFDTGATIGSSDLRPWWRRADHAGAGYSRLRFKRPEWGSLEMTEIAYTASGGESLLMRLDNGDEVQVEIHVDSYSVLWSSQLSAAATFRNLVPLMPGAPLEAMAGDVDGTVTDGDVTAVLAVIASDDARRRLAFFRLRYEGRIVTWEQRPLHSPDSGRWIVVAEVGILLTCLDEGYLAELIRNTAPRLSVAASALVRRAAKVITSATGSFPVAELAPAQSDHGDAAASG